MKTRRFLIAAVSGVLCGLTVQFVKHSRKNASATFSGNSLITDSAFVSGFVADDGFESLEARLARYSSEPPPQPVPSGSHEARTTVDRLLRMLLLPVTGESIAEGVAALNVAGESSYSSSESAIFCRWAEVAPEAALAAVDMIRAPETKSLLLPEVFRHYGALAAKFSEAGRTGEFVSALQSAALEGDSGGLAKTAQWLTQHSPSGLDELTIQASRTIPFATARWLTVLMEYTKAEGGFIGRCPPDRRQRFRIKRSKPPRPHSVECVSCHYDIKLNVTIPQWF